MILLLLVACTKAPPPREIPLGTPVPADYLGVAGDGFVTAGTPLPTAGALRLADPELALRGVGTDGVDTARYTWLDGYDGVVLGALGPTLDATEADASWTTAAADLVEAVPAVDHWEVWQRPEADGVDPAALADATCALADVVGADGLVGPSLAWSDPTTAATWLSGFLDEGGGDCVSGFAADLGAADPEAGLEDVVDEVRDLLKDAGYVAAPIWSTGAGVAPDDADVAGFVARWFLVQWPHGVDRAFMPGWGGDGLLAGADGPTAAGEALDTLGAWLVGRDLTGCVAEGTTWTCTLRTEATRDLVAWDTSGLGELGVPEDIVAIERLDGTEEDVGATVALTSAPVLLRGG